MVERITFDDGHQGECAFLDEVVTEGGAHLEALDSDKKGSKRWFLSLVRSDGTTVRLWIKGRVTMIEDDKNEES